MIHDFSTNLEASQKPEDNDFILKKYQDFFDNCINIDYVDFKENPELQKKGIDVIVTLDNGKIETIEEKRRFQSFNDILIETVSQWYGQNNSYNKPGWIYTCQADILAYIVIPDHKIYMLPMFFLKKAFQRNQDEWLVKYTERYSNNRNYRSLNTPVPIDVLREAIDAEIWADKSL